MVAIEQQYGEASGSWLTALLADFARIVATPFKFVARAVRANNAVVHQQKRVRVAEKISRAAAIPTQPVAEETPRICTLRLTIKLDAMAGSLETATSTIEQERQSVDGSLDWIAYELDAIRRDISDHLPT